MILKVIFRAKDIPEGATVTKLTGSVEYTLHRKITIYGSKDDDKPQVIEAKDGAVFLSVDGKSINCYDGKKEFVWLVEEYDLVHFLTDVFPQ